MTYRRGLFMTKSPKMQGFNQLVAQHLGHCFFSHPKSFLPKTPILRGFKSLQLLQKWKSEIRTNL